MLNSPNVKKIIENKKSMNKKITQLTEENIFAVKFKQIAKTGGLMEKLEQFITVKDSFAKALTHPFKFIKDIKTMGRSKNLTEALQENCPPTRSLRSATKYIKKTYGDKYDNIFMDQLENLIDKGLVKKNKKHIYFNKRRI